ncbi:MAG: hypothetical protein WD847_12880 [Pirellulales bacterium]
MKLPTWRSIAVVCIVAGSALALGKWSAWTFSSWPVASAGVPDAPRLATGRRERDLGRLRQGTTHRVAFAVSNRGTRRLILTDRGNCCGEETPPVQLVVPPGESLNVVIELDTSRWFGQVRHMAEYDTNDPQAPSLAFTITALVE